MTMPSQHIETFFAQTLQRIRDHQERFWAIVGAVVLSALFIALVLRHRQTESDEAWSQLGSIQSQFMQGKLTETKNALDSWETRFKGTDARTYAQFIKADLLYKTSDYVQASQVYGEIVQSGRPDTMKPIALSAQISCEEMAGRLPQALALAEAFLNQYPDHFMAAPRYISHARLLELSGDKAAAVAVYNRFVLLFPQSPWTELARTRTQALSGLPQK